MVFTEEPIAKVLLTSRFWGHREQNGRKTLLTSRFLGHREHRESAKQDSISHVAKTLAQKVRYEGRCACTAAEITL